MTTTLISFTLCLQSRTFKEHKGLELSLDDTHRVLRDLHSAVGVVVLAILSLAWLVILDTVYILPKDEETGLKAYIFILFLALAVAYVFHVVWEKDGDGVRFFFRHQIQVGETCTIDGEMVRATCNLVFIFGPNFSAVSSYPFIFLDFKKTLFQAGQVLLKPNR